MIDWAAPLRQSQAMPKRSSKPEKDVNTLASKIVDAATRDAPAQEEIRRVMAEMGRRGGLKGGVERAKRLTDRRRREIASAAAKARWKSSK